MARISLDPPKTDAEVFEEHRGLMFAVAYRMLRPITGASKVARWVVGVAGRPPIGIEFSDLSLEPAEINGMPGTLITAGGQAVAALTLAVCAGQITGIQLLANPDKLTAIMAGRTLPRS